MEELNVCTVHAIQKFVNNRWLVGGWPESFGKVGNGRNISAKGEKILKLNQGMANPKEGGTFITKKRS